MSYSIDKKTGDITFGGFEKGIASSPHAGVGDLKGLNISSIPGEVMLNYTRIQQSQIATSGSITFNGTNVVTHSGLNVVSGTVITISGSSDGTISNGDYWVNRLSPTTFNLSSTFANYVVSTFATAAGSTSASFVTVNMATPNSYAYYVTAGGSVVDYFINDTVGRVWWNRPTSTLGWTLIENSTNNATAIFIFGSILFQCQSGTSNALRYKGVNALGTTWTAFQDFNIDSADGYTHFTLVSLNGVAYIADGIYIDTLSIVPGKTFDPTDSSTYTWTTKALTVPFNDSVITIGELVSTTVAILIGGNFNVIYNWDGQSSTIQTTNAGTFILLPENYTSKMLTVNNLVYIFCGVKGNIYVTNGSSVTSVITVPDYVANNTGANQDPYYTWGGIMYLRGRIWFSVLAPNCGGIWSFVPTINYYLQQDTGASLRCEVPNSYNTYSGYTTVMFPTQSIATQDALGPQFYSGWTSGASTYGIDFSGTVPYIGGAIIETDLVPTGTMLEKKTFKQQEYKLSAPLIVGESIQLYYRVSMTDSFTSCGTVNADSSGLSGYFSSIFEKTQYLQIKVVLTGTTSSPSWTRLQNIYIR